MTHSSSETPVIAPMLDQSARVSGAHAKELLLDAGYFDDEGIEATLASDVNILGPEGQWPTRSKEAGLFHKSAFDYDTHTDSYRYPAGQTLVLLSQCAKHCEHERMVYMDMQTAEAAIYGRTARMQFKEGA